MHFALKEREKKGTVLQRSKPIIHFFFFHMAKVCDSCGKKPQSGHSVSHSNVKAKRRFMPNLVKKSMMDTKTQKMVETRVCTKCLKGSAK